MYKQASVGIVINIEILIYKVKYFDFMILNLVKQKRNKQISIGFTVEENEL